MNCVTARPPPPPSAVTAVARGGAFPDGQP